MKRFKKMMALIIAMVMVIGMMSTVAVSAATKSQKITIAGLEEGDTVKLYKVLAWADDSATAKEKLAVNGWYWADPFDDTFYADADNDKMEDTLYAAVDSDNKLQISSELAGQIARALNDAGTDVPVETKKVGPNKTFEYSFTAVDEAATKNDGLYMAIVTPEKTDHVYNPIFVHIDSNTVQDSFTVTPAESYTADTKAAKKSEVTVNKNSKSNDDYTDNVNGKNTTNLEGQETVEDDKGDLGKTVKPGDELTFTVKTVIPGYSKIYKKPVFNVSDTMVDLIYQKNVRVYLDVDGNKGDEISTDKYTVKKSTDDGYKIEFKPEYLQTLKTAQAIILEYTAKVPETVSDEDAANVTREKNTVVLEFSHDPSTESDEGDGGKKKYEKDITNHYTFAIDANALWNGNNKEEGPGHSGSEIIKVAVDKDGNPITESHATAVFPAQDGSTTTVNGTLAGAEFMLYYGKEEGGNFVIDESKPVYKTNIITDDEGRMNMTGLDAGTYFLKEIKAPAGFVKSSDVVKIDIEATFRMQKYTEYYDQDGNWFKEPGDGRTKYDYEAKELASYTIKYNDELASSHTFNHVEESDATEAKVSSDVDSVTEMPHSIKNTKGVELPSTGGMGTTIFYVVGAILVLGAGVVLVTRRRMSAN